MKKLFAVLMAIALVLSMGTTFAFAADEKVETGTIKIYKAFDGADYDIYEMLKFEPSNNAATKGVYTIVNGWADFFADGNGYIDDTYFDVTDNNGKTTVTMAAGLDAEQMQEIAKAAIAYAEDKGIAPTDTKTADGETVEFTGLELGYYAVDSSLGIFCGLSNSNSTFTAYEKNVKPDINKFVQEDSTGDWGDVNDADIDQVVNYKSTITVGKGATNYVMHDTMEAGLTFNNDVVVKYVNGDEEVTVADTNYTVVSNPSHEKADGTTETHTFDIKFEDAFIADLEDKGITSFTVYYSATLNKNAVIGAEEDGNENTVKLSYGEDSTWETNEHKTSTYTWQMEVFKYMKEHEGENEPKIPLAGAKFQLLDKDGNAIEFVRLADTDGVPTYRVAVDGDTDVTDTIVTEKETGKFIILGLDEGSYSLHETDAPAGYNKLAQDLAVTITSKLEGREDDNVSYGVNGDTPNLIEVENKTGGLFPETGGIGTTIFYMVGGLLMLAAFVVLVSKKRMSAAA